MGYRSNVSIAIYGPDDVMTAFIAGQRIKQSKWLVDDEEVTQITIDAKPCTLIHATFEDVKWYAGYEDVDWWGAIISDAADFSDEGICAEFIRVGEDNSDTQCDYYGNDVQYFSGVNREVYADFPAAREDKP
jgi:hypothetical protein